MIGTPFADAAWDLATIGLPVMALRGGTKLPLSGGHGCHDATRDLDEVQRLARRFPRANIGIATGRMTVVDIDPRSGGFETQARLEQEGRVLPDGPVSKTANGGRHHLFATPDGVPCRTNLLPGWDIKGRGGYIVAPPSVVGATGAGPGGHYEWIRTPFEAPFPPLPAWLRVLITPPRSAPVQRAAIPVDDADGMRRQALHDLQSAVDEYASLTDGRRVGLFRLACRVGKYVANGVITEHEFTAAFLDAAHHNGAIHAHGLGWAHATLASALRAAQADPLPPLARAFRTEAHA